MRLFIWILNFNIHDFKSRVFVYSLYSTYPHVFWHSTVNNTGQMGWKHLLYSTYFVYKSCHVLQSAICTLQTQTNDSVVAVFTCKQPLSMWGWGQLGRPSLPRRPWEVWGFSSWMLKEVTSSLTPLRAIRKQTKTKTKNYELISDWKQKKRKQKAQLCSGSNPNLISYTKGRYEP